MARYATEPTPALGGAVGPPSLLRWGPVLGGAIIGFAVMLILASLWLALAYATGVEAVEANLDWFMAGSLIASMFIGGYLAGWLAGVPGAGPGFFNGLTVFGLVLVALMVASVPTLEMFGLDPRLITPEEATGELTAQGDALWAPFLALLIGALAGGLGGALGGSTTRPAVFYLGDDDTRERMMHVPPHEHRDGETIDLREPVPAARTRDTTIRERDRDLDGDNEVR